MTAAALLCAALAAPGPPGPPGPPALPPGPPELPPGVWAYEPFDAAGGRLATDGGAGWAGPWRPSGWRLFGPAPHHLPWHPPGTPHLVTSRSDRFFAAAEPPEAPGWAAAGLAAAGGAASAPALDPDINIVARPLRAQVARPGAAVYVGVRLRADAQLHEGAGAGFFAVMLDGGENHDFRQCGPSVSFGKPFAQRGSERASMFREWALSTDFHPNELRALRVRGRPVTEPILAVEDGWGAGGKGGHQLATGVPVVLGRPALLVLRVEYGKAGGGSRYDLFVNPDPAAARHPPSQAAFVMEREVGSPDLWVTLAGSGAFTVDEIRVADSLAGACGYTPPEDAKDAAAADD